jgi:hypothetical protein
MSDRSQRLFHGLLQRRPEVLPFKRAGLAAFFFLRFHPSDLPASRIPVNVFGVVSEDRSRSTPRDEGMFFEVGL